MDLGIVDGRRSTAITLDTVHREDEEMLERVKCVRGDPFHSVLLQQGASRSVAASVKVNAKDP